MSIYEVLRDNLLAVQKKSGRTKRSIEQIISMAANFDNRRENEIRYDTRLCNELRAAISILIDEGMLFPIKKKVYDVLSYDSFYVAKIESQIEDRNYYSHMLNKLYRFNMVWYNDRYDEFIADKDSLEAIHEYLLEDKKPRLTANELGFRLFRDEKAFEEPDTREMKENDKRIGFAMKLINRVGVTLEMLNAYRTIEPFFFYVNESFYTEKNRTHRILIIENKDTFYSIVYGRCSCIDRHDYDMYIFGEGEKIISSFSLAEDYGIHAEDEIVYFGDIDLAGIQIYASLDRYYSEYRIRLGANYYKLLIDRYDDARIKKTRFAQRFSDMEIIRQVIYRELDDITAKRVIRILSDESYIPQEAIVLCNAE